MIWNRQKIAILIGAMSLNVACSKEDALPTQDVQTHTSTKVYPTELPTGAEVTDCASQPEAPLLCDWVGSADAVVWGELVDVRMVSFPAALVTDPLTTVMDCSGPVDAALELVLNIKEIYHGTPPETLTIRVGHHQLDKWQPRPALSPQGELVWIGDGPRLEAGNHIGAAVHKSPTGDMWGLMGETLFADSANGSSVAQGRAFCQEPAPVGLAGLTRAELGTAILACPTQLSAEAVTRASEIDNFWAQTSYAYAGMCHQGAQHTSD